MLILPKIQHTMASGSTVKKIAKIVAAVLTSSVLMATGSAAIASTTSSDISIAQAQPLLMVPNTTNVPSWHSSHSSHSSHMSHMSHMSQYSGRW